MKNSLLKVVSIVSVLFSYFLCGLGVSKDASTDMQANLKKAGTPSDYTYVDDTLNLTDDDNLYVSLTSATKTDLGESFNIRFAANTVLYPVGRTGINAYQEVNGVHVTPNDESYPADKTLNQLTKYDVDILEVTEDDPLVEKDDEGHAVRNENGEFVLIEGHGYIHERPQYNAYVSRIDAANTARNGYDTVVIPYSITYGDWFDLKITEFGENVIFNSARTYDQIYDGIKTIIIGDNIEKIPENALPDAPADLVVKSTFSERPAEWSAAFTNATVEYGYEPTEHQKEIYDISPRTDEEGNILYFDDKGFALNEEGQYLDDEGNVIYITNADGDPEPKTFDGTPLTDFKAYKFSANAKKDQAAEKTFIVGNVDPAKNINLPLLIQYDVYKDDTKVDTRIYECPIDDPTETYEGVGANAGKYVVNKSIDIRLNEGEEIDKNSFKFYNIFEADVQRREDGTLDIKADTTSPYRSIPSVAFADKHLISDFLTISYKASNTVFGYTSFTLNVDLVDGAYQKVKASTFKTFANRINNGEYKIRYSFKGLKTAYYHIVYDGQDKILKINDSVNGGVPGDYDFFLFKANKNNELTFFIDNSKISENFDFNKLEKIELCSFRITLDLCSANKGTTQIVTKSDISFRFGAMDLLPKDTKTISRFDGNLFLVIYAVCFVALYIGGTVAYYLYAARAYRNDEFRRVNGKAYIKRMSKAFIGAVLMAGALAFILLRFVFINPSIIVFNPMDVYVILFGVGGLISFGYFIKFLVLFVRQEKERRKAMRLKLDEDVESDGTN